MSNFLSSPLLAGFFLAVSLVVGPGLFSVPSLVVEHGISTSVFAWVITALAVLPFLYAFYCLGRRKENVTGMTDWATEAFGAGMGNTVSLLQLLALLCLIPVLASAGASYAASFLGLKASATPLLAFGFLIVALLPNLTREKHLTAMTKISFIALLLLLVGLLAFHSRLIFLGFNSTAHSVGSEGMPSLPSIWKVSMMIFFTFVGWENYSSAAQGQKVSRKTLSAIYSLSYLFVVGLYLSLALLIAGAKMGGVAVHGASGLGALIEAMPFGFFFKGILVLVCLSNISAWMKSAWKLLFTVSGRPARSRLPLFVLMSVPVCVITLQYYAELSLASMIHFANQNFLLLYCLVVMAFFRLHAGVVRWVILFSIAMPLSLLAMGVGWTTLICTAPIVIGYLQTLKVRVPKLPQVPEWKSEAHVVYSAIRTA